MTDGEKLVWAAAFVEKYKALNDPMHVFYMRDASERKRQRASRQIAEEAAQFADEAVDVMKLAQRVMKKGVGRKTTAYQRLTEMLS